MKFSGKFDPVNLTAAALLAVTAAVNLISSFFLPERLPALAASNVSATLPFLIGGILLVGVSGVMAVFGPSKKRWIVTQAILVFADLAVVAVNLFRS